MLDLKRIRNNPEEIKELMADRGENFDLSVIDEVVSLDKRRRDMLIEVEELKNRRNTQSALIPKLKKSGENVDEIMTEMKKLSDEIKNFDIELSEVDEKIKNIMLRIPNIPNVNVPAGNTDEDNVEIRKWGEPKNLILKLKLIGI